MIKTIIFDWGGVLIDNPSEALMVYCSSVLGVSVESFKKEFLENEELFQKGLLAESDLWQKICNNLKVEQANTKSLWTDAIRQAFVEKEDVWQLVADLKNNGYQLGLLSNTEIPTMEYFFEKGYDKYFDELIFSCNENFIKPEAEIYRIALSRLGVKASEVVFVGDNLENIAGADILNINTLVFKDARQLKEELRKHKINI